MKTIKVFEAFAGYGSQLMALERLQKMFGCFNIYPIGYSEIDPIPIKAYELVHGTEIKNYGDVSNIDWNSVPDLICSPTPSHVPTSLTLAYRKVLRKVVAHAHPFFGNARRL